ncbi:MAG TPA: response regulator [Gemmatimonadaceae bacterium]|nr:response regulator [Gemmatimonadaceae bacterium]
MAPARVLIVEDDPTVAKIHRTVVDSHPGFVVSATATTAEEAFRVLARGTPIDLLILDLMLPGADGVQLLRKLRAAGGPDVMAVTAHRDARTVNTLLHLGVVDYLVKPFTLERFREGLERFRDRTRTLTSAALEQADIDTCLHRNHDLLPKGLRADTLDLVRHAATEEPAGVTADQIAARASIARVTARRYLEYLVTAGQMVVEPDPGSGPGRPHNVYRWAWPPGGGPPTARDAVSPVAASPAARVPAPAARASSQHPARVLIVEDDPTVAKIHRTVVDSHPGFVVSATATTAEEALKVLARGTPIDLLILDLMLPGADGVRLLRKLRAAGGPDVMAVTAHRDTRTVSALLSFGVVDYLVKPFTLERFREGLERFRDRTRTLTSAALDQADIDSCLHRDRDLLPKGLRADTLDLVRRAATEGAAGVTADQIAARASIARVTARRYLEYLVTAGQMVVEPDAGSGPGRPHNLYRWAWPDRAA